MQFCQESHRVSKFVIGNSHGLKMDDVGGGGEGWGGLQAIINSSRHTGIPHHRFIVKPNLLLPSIFKHYFRSLQHRKSEIGSCV